MILIPWVRIYLKKLLCFESVLLISVIVHKGTRRDILTNLRYRSVQNWLTDSMTAVFKNVRDPFSRVNLLIYRIGDLSV